MANHGCNNGTLEGTSYSSPMPLIGLYIASASTVCTFLMIYDILSGFISRKRWFPCKSFKLNSVTLSLVAIVLKLPVDLTTSMPGAKNQLSKLCGTIFLCIYMGFIMPSVSVMNDATDLFALSILVITIFVNISIQISTGVIVLFIPEHIIILCCMLVLLLILWVFAWDNDKYLKRINPRTRYWFGEYTGSVLKRLKECYVDSYNKNPQFLACQYPACATICGLSILGLIVLLETAFRSLILKKAKFCEGLPSDYGWSMGVIVVTQILAVIVGTLATCFRWLTMFDHIYAQSLFHNMNSDSDLYYSNPTFRHDVKHVALNASYRLLRLTAYLVHMLFILPSNVFQTLIYSSACSSVFKRNNSDSSFFKTWKDLGGLRLEHWGKQYFWDFRSRKDMKTWIETSLQEPNHLSQLLTSAALPSLQSIDTKGILDSGTDALFVRVVLLVRIAQVSLPQHLSTSLQQSFSEAYEIVYFICKCMALTSDKIEFAKFLWTAPFKHAVLSKQSRLRKKTSKSELLRAISMMKKLKGKVYFDDVTNEIRNTVRLINPYEHSSIEDLHAHMMNIYVYILHKILAELPNAISNAMTGRTGDEFQERIRVSLKFICKLESLENKIRWKFPRESDMTSLITDSQVLAPVTESLDKKSNDVASNAAEDNVPAAIIDDPTSMEVEGSDSIV